MIYESRYQTLLDEITNWAEQEYTVKALIIIGSQVQPKGLTDIWSDLDLMMLVETPQIYLSDDDWLESFEEVACSYIDDMSLGNLDWSWTVKRVLFSNGLDVDFNILPVEYLDSVLDINREIIAQGHCIIYDSTGIIEDKIQAQYHRPEIEELEISGLVNVINDILYNVVWTKKRLLRGELWNAVYNINSHINKQLLRLIETQNQKPGEISYDGRYLETRTNKEILSSLSNCYTKYDLEDALSTLNYISSSLRLLPLT